MISLRLLVADDDADMRGWLVAVLGQRGTRIREAESGAELVHLLAEDGPFDLVISDVRMSWATGLQALAMARTAGFATPFVLITGRADESLLREAAELGAVVLEKPLAPESLLETIACQLERRRAAMTG